MRHYPTLGYRHLAARDAFQYRHPLLKQFEGFDVNQIGARQPVLRDQNGLLVPLDVREEFGRLAFESSDEFGAHEWHYSGTFGVGQDYSEAAPLSLTLEQRLALFDPVRRAGKILVLAAIGWEREL